MAELNPATSESVPSTTSRSTRRKDSPSALSGKSSRSTAAEAEPDRFTTSNSTSLADVFIAPVLALVAGSVRVRAGRLWTCVNPQPALRCAELRVESCGSVLREAH